MFVVFFFFFKQKTAYELRISDWSSDVCSSDLFGVAIVPLHRDFDVDRNQRPGPQRNVCRPGGMENAGMQRRLRLVDVIDESFDPAREREILFLAVTQIEQTNADAVVEK